MKQSGVMVASWFPTPRVGVQILGLLPLLFLAGCVDHTMEKFEFECATMGGRIHRCGAKQQATGRSQFWVCCELEATEGDVSLRAQ